MDYRFENTIVDDGGGGSSITSPPKVDFATQSKEIVQQQTQNSPFVQAFVNTQNAISNQVATGSGNPGNTSPSVTFTGPLGQPVTPVLPGPAPVVTTRLPTDLDKLAETNRLKAEADAKLKLEEEAKLKALEDSKVVLGNKNTKDTEDTKDTKDIKTTQGQSSLTQPFSWMQEGKDAAQVQYDADALKAEQNALFARQEFMREAEQGQTQKDVQKYLDNQSAEKAGWTGGYRLDQDRQRQYLEATVQASMYNAQEMQKFGLESSLQAARLAYEQGKTALAMEYYKLELDRSMNEAQLTGIYFSPEQKDMLGQLKAAEDTYNNLTVSTEDKDRAGKIINSIENWFSTNGLSKEGIRTLAKLDSDRNDLMVKQSTILAAIETIPSGAYALKDNKGNYIMSADGLTVQYFMPSIANSADKYDYFSGNYVIDGKTVDTGRQVFVQELSKLNNETLNTWYGNLSQTDKEKSATELTAMLTAYMATASNPLHNFVKGIVNENNQQLNYEEVLGGTGKYKDGFYQTEYTVAGKTFGVNYNLNTGEVVVRDSVANLDNNPSGVVLTDENKNQVTINQSNNFTNFSASNPTLKLYRETPGGMAGNTLVEIKDRNDLNLNQFNSTTAEVNKENYKKLFAETYNLFGGAYVYDYYGKLVDGKVMLKRVQTNK
jgi:hypothetical protein